MRPKLFSVLFWNIWFENKLQSETAVGHMLDEMEQLIEQYQPDCICVNEALQHILHHRPFIFEHLEKFDYNFTHFGVSSPVSEDYLIGSALASRIEPASVKILPISGDTPAKRRGFGDDHTVKSVIAKIPLEGKAHVNVMVSHPLHLRGYNLREHFKGTRELRRILSKPEYSKNTIIGGDFNEPRLLPGSFRSRMQHTMHYRTGKWLHPTWRHKNRRLTPLRANLDQVLWTKKGNLHLRRFEIARSHVSDHRPLYAEFEYK